VKGKTETTRVFELLPVAEGIEEDRQFNEKYQQALTAYRRRDWPLAESIFRECLQLRPGDGPSAAMAKRIPLSSQNPPANNWDGSWQLETK
jgi:hypothetical protein